MLTPRRQPNTPVSIARMCSPLKYYKIVSHGNSVNCALHQTLGPRINKNGGFIRTYKRSKAQLTALATAFTTALEAARERDQTLAHTEEDSGEADVYEVHAVCVVGGRVDVQSDWGAALGVWVLFFGAGGVHRWFDFVDIGHFCFLFEVYVGGWEMGICIGEAAEECYSIQYVCFMRM